MPGMGVPGSFFPAAELMFVPSVEAITGLSAVVNGATGECLEVNTSPAKPYTHKNQREEHFFKYTFHDLYPWA